MTQFLPHCKPRLGGTVRYSRLSSAFLQLETNTRQLEQFPLRSLLEQQKHTNVFSMMCPNETSLHCILLPIQHSPAISLFVLLF